MSRSKNRKIADLISGTTFDDGVVAASEVTGLATVATSGSFNDLSNQPTPFDPSTLGTASTQATGAFATAAQGTTANAALPKAGGAVTGNVTFGDSNKIVMGAGSDLSIYHDGSASRIHDNGTGNLILSATDFQMNNGANNETMFTAVSGGAVTLKHSGNNKIATTSSGIDVTGTVNADALTGIGSIDATTAAAIGAAGVGGGAVELLVDNASVGPSTTYIEVSFTGDYRMYIVQFVNVGTNSSNFCAQYTNSSGTRINSTSYYQSSTGGGSFQSNAIFLAGENSRPIDGISMIHDPYSTTSYSVANNLITREYDFQYGFQRQNKDNSTDRHYGIHYWVGGTGGPSGQFTYGNYNVWGVTAP